MMTRIKLVLLTPTLGVLAGCASITSQEEAGAAARASLPETPAVWATAQETVGDVEVGWIDRIGDAKLSSLVREAQANNKNLQAAAANVEKSRALAKQAGAALQPNVSLTAGASGSGVVDSGAPASRSSNVGLALSWELDVWGRIRAGKSAAVASAQAAQADYVYTQYSLAAAVARAYFLSIEAGRQADVARKSLEALTETDRIVQVQHDNGLATAQDVALSRSDLASTRSTLAQSEAGQRDALRALEVLLGRYPSADVDVGTALPATPALPPAGVPSELLERRPDVIAAERNVAAAFNSLDQAKAAQMPAISLTSSIGGSSNQLANMLNPTNLAWTAAGNLVAPLFDGGLRKAQVAEANADQQAAIAAYGQTALEAFQEVESSLDQNVVLRERETALAESATEANKALDIARIRYNEGETDLLDVLTIQQRVFTADSNFVSIERERLDEWVTLNLALGGSWE